MKKAEASKWLIRGTTMGLVIMLLVGVVLILISINMLYPGKADYVPELLKELGIVISSVCTVSLLYEWLQAEIRVEEFRSLMRDEMHLIEANARSCAELGIKKLYSTRDAYEREYPFDETMKAVPAGSRIRIVAVTLFHVMNKTSFLIDAMKRGVNIELCMLSPNASDDVKSKMPDLQAGECADVVSLFRQRVAEWAKREQPSGSVEFRYHEMPLHESFANFPTGPLGVWDLSFGRDVKEKRIILVDPSRTLGQDLARRFGFVYDNATVIFRYEGQQVSVDRFR